MGRDCTILAPLWWGREENHLRVRIPLLRRYDLWAAFDELAPRPLPTAVVEITGDEIVQLTHDGSGEPLQGHLAYDVYRAIVDNNDANQAAAGYLAPLPRPAAQRGGIWTRHEASG